MLSLFQPAVFTSSSLVTAYNNGYSSVFALNFSLNGGSLPTELLFRVWVTLPGRFTANQFVLATTPLRLSTSIFFFQLNTCFHSPYITSSLAKGWLCTLQFLLALASAVILRPNSRGTRDQILPSEIRDSPNLEGQVPVFISPRHWVTFSSPTTTRRATVEVFDPWTILESESESESYVTTDGQSASLSSNKAPIWGFRPDFITVWQLQVCGCGALSLTRGRVYGLQLLLASPALSFSVRVPWDSRPYFTVSDLRLPFSSPPTTRRATVEVFDPRLHAGFLNYSCFNCPPYNPFARTQ
jgi:hypothetical protein